MDFRLRLMPLAIVAALALLGVKLANIWLALDAPVASARAQNAGEPPAKPSAPAAKPDPAATKPASQQATSALDPSTITPSELGLLQKLAERRGELDKRSAELSQREVLLQATEKRIDEKIARLEALEKDIGGIVEKQAEEDEARIKSLVKIYETMKPHDAARIFEQLDMPVLLGVLEHMKERSTAAILAGMDPAKARTVTQALAERKDRRMKADAAVEKPQARVAKP